MTDYKTQLEFTLEVISVSGSSRI